MVDRDRCVNRSRLEGPRSPIFEIFLTKTTVYYSSYCTFRWEIDKGAGMIRKLGTHQSTCRTLAYIELTVISIRQRFAIMLLPDGAKSKRQINVTQFTRSFDLNP